MESETKTVQFNLDEVAPVFSLKAKSLTRHVTELKDFPDPNPSPEGGLPTIDDVTRLNATSVARVFHVRNEHDIQHVIKLARVHNKKISIRGTKHSMGSHTITAGGYVIDCCCLRVLSYDSKTQIVTTGPGKFL